MEKTSKKSKIEPVHIEEAARLKELFDARSTTSQMKFGADNEIGSQGMVWQYLNARAPLNLDAAIKFAKGLGCPVSDFSPRLAESLSGAGDLDRSSADTTPSDNEFSLIPQLDLQASCGHGKFAEHVVVKGGLAFKRSSLRDFGVPEDRARIVYASGQSMEPTIGHGRVVLVNMADTTPVDGRVFLICDPDGAIYLKRLVREYHAPAGGMAWIMRSDNPNKNVHPDKLLPQDSRTSIVGRAVWNDNAL